MSCSEITKKKLREYNRYFAKTQGYVRSNVNFFGKQHYLIY